jgi:hypothetical protein
MCIYFKKKSFSERGVTRKEASIIRGFSLFAGRLGMHPLRISREHCILQKAKYIGEHK